MQEIWTQILGIDKIDEVDRNDLMTYFVSINIKFKDILINTLAGCAWVSFDSSDDQRNALSILQIERPQWLFDAQS